MLPRLWNDLDTWHVSTSTTFNWYHVAARRLSSAIVGDRQRAQNRIGGRLNRFRPAAGPKCRGLQVNTGPQSVGSGVVGPAVVIDRSIFDGRRPRRRRRRHRRRRRDCNLVRGCLADGGQRTLYGHRLHGRARKQYSLRTSVVGSLLFSSDAISNTSDVQRRYRGTDRSDASAVRIDIEQEAVKRHSHHIT